MRSETLRKTTSRVFLCLVQSLIFSIAIICNWLTQIENYLFVSIFVCQFVFPQNISFSLTCITIIFAMNPNISKAVDSVAKMMALGPPNSIRFVHGPVGLFRFVSYLRRFLAYSNILSYNYSDSYIGPWCGY